jgi:hypothetical protein
MRATMLVKASVLAITLALGAVPVWAQPTVPTVGVGGACIEDTLPLIYATTLIPVVGVRLTMPNPNALWHCVANCSVQADNPGDPGIRAQLALRVDGAVDPRTERNFELTHDPDPGDADYVEVSTGVFVRDLSGRGGIHRFECAARKLVAAGPHFYIPRACINIVCSETVLHSEDDVDVSD